MNRSGYLVAVIFLSACLSVSAFAQTQATRHVYLNTNAFYDEKAGITKLVSALKAVDTEFASRIKALQDGATRLAAIGRDIEAIQKLPPAQINQASLAAKIDEGERLQRELKYTREDLEKAIAKRRDEVVAPISREIGKAINEFAAKNGIASILDAGKLNETGSLLFLTASSDMTTQFITFFNTRPATLAPPK